MAWVLIVERDTTGILSAPFAPSFSEPSSMITTHGEGLVSYGNALYAIFTEGRDVWDISGGGYAPNQLVKLDGNLNVLAKKPMFGKNLDGFTPGAYIRQGNLLYAVDRKSVV